MNSRSVGPNPIHPDHLTTKERLGELCSILALGILRLRAREHVEAGQSSDLFDREGESSLDRPARPSGHATRPTQRTRRRA